MCAALAIGAIARAQSLDPGFNSSAIGEIRAVALQADGKIVIGGNFSWFVTGDVVTTRNSIARLNADGSLDMAFNPGANGPVRALAVQADGKIVVSGEFTGLGGSVDTGWTPRNHIGRLNADGSLDTTFNPGANDVVVALALQSDGKILAGGNFNQLGCGGIGGCDRSHIGRLNSNGSLDDFNPGANDQVFALVVEANGYVLAGGDFTLLGGGGSSILGTPRFRIGEISPGGSLTGFGSGDGANNRVNAVAVQADGKIVVGGEFTTLGFGGGLTGSAPHNLIGRLNADGSLDTSFNPGAGPPSGAVFAVAVQADGRILLGGYFLTLGGGGTGTTTRNSIGRLNADGSLDTSFDPGTDGLIEAFAVQSDGKIVVAGDFNSLGRSGGGHDIGRLLPTVSSALPVITAQPQSQSVTAGADATFTVVVSGTPAPTLQWQVSADFGTTWTNLTDASPYSGVTSSTLTISAVTLSLNGTQFRCVATNSNGSATSEPADLMVGTLCRIVECSATVPASASAGVPVAFSASATVSECPGTTTYAWTFGDGSNGAGQNPTHVYAANGTYLWDFTATNGYMTCGRAGRISIGQTAECPTMVANQNIFLSYSDASGSCGINRGTCLSGQNINFSAAAFGYNFGCGGHTISWSFGDGGMASGRIVVHAFDSPGTYDVLLTIKNASQTLQIPASVLIGGSIDFSVKPYLLSGILVPNGYTFHPVTSWAVTKWNWDFGDGTCPTAGDNICTSTGDITHIFPDARNYRVTLSVNGLFGIGATVKHSLFPTRRRAAGH